MRAPFAVASVIAAGLGLAGGAFVADRAADTEPLGLALAPENREFYRAPGWNGLAPGTINLVVAAGAVRRGG